MTDEYFFLLWKLIFCREYTRAEDSDWHLDHFCCLRCDVGLGGQQYRAQDRSPFCLSCYEDAFTTPCEVSHVCACVCVQVCVWGAGRGGGGGGGGGGGSRCVCMCVCVCIHMTVQTSLKGKYLE